MDKALSSPKADVLVQGSIQGETNQADYVPTDFAPSNNRLTDQQNNPAPCDPECKFHSVSVSVTLTTIQIPANGGNSARVFVPKSPTGKKVIFILAKPPEE